MSSRNESFVRFRRGLEVVSTRRFRYADACLASLRWVRDAFILVGAATLLAWLVVKFVH